jgi:hypothetical protein
MKARLSHLGLSSFETRAKSALLRMRSESDFQIDKQKGQPAWDKTSN